MAIKKWVIRQADKERASQISEKFNIDPFVAFLMVSRGIVDDIDVVNFMTDEFMLSSPFTATMTATALHPQLCLWIFCVVRVLMFVIIFRAEKQRATA